MSAQVFVIIFLYLIYSVAHAEPLPEQCENDCIATFGATLGKSMSGIKAFSNCNNSCVNPEPYFIDGTFTGIKWQCVEYARRWLLENKGVVYGDVDIAADIWQLEYVSSTDRQKQIRFKGILNGSKEFSLRRGDLLIYSRVFYGTGHVAVVLKVDESKQLVYVGEQNYNNQIWSNEYAREIPFITRENETWLLDSYIIGWKRVVSD